jgi:biotin carboxyl carrier protein
MVVTVKVEAEQRVKRGEPLLILEAMKMENQLRSPVDGRIMKIHVEEGRKVEKGEELITMGL